MSKISIYVLTHKKFEEPQDDMYVPILNGSSSHDEDFNYIRDDSGDNISDLNNYYAELTGEYWVWKNSDADVVGFCHYRRYFAKSLMSFKLLEKNDIEDILKDYDMILPEKVHMGMSNTKEIEKSRMYLDYGPYTEEYCRLREVIESDFPDYLEEYDRMLESKTSYWFNMFICRKELADDYFKWLFDVLFKLQPKIDFAKYSENQRRILGFLSERLMAVYINKNNIKVTEKPVLHNDRRFPRLYVIGFRFSVIIILFKFFIKIRYLMKNR